MMKSGWLKIELKDAAKENARWPKEPMKLYELIKENNNDNR